MTDKKRFRDSPAAQKQPLRKERRRKALEAEYQEDSRAKFGGQRPERTGAVPEIAAAAGQNPSTCAMNESSVDGARLASSPVSP